MALRSIEQSAPEAASECVADGLRVLELGPGLSGAIAGLILADNGADVIRVEPPGGDPLRAHPAHRMWSRGKQALRADLEQERDRERVASLAAEADVVLSSWRLGVDARFGLDPDRIAARNPRAVVCRITGFGPRGPYAHYPAWDGIVAAKAGRMLEFCGLVGGARPAYAAVPVAGWCASQLALHGILAALLDRERTGRGRRVETSLVQALGIYDLVNWLPGYTMMLRVADVPYLPYTNACTKDGVWLQFAQLSPAQFRAFIRDLALDEIWGDPRFRHAPALRDPEQMRALRAIVLARVREKTYADWMSIFDADSDIAVERFRTPAEAMEHPQIVHNGDVVEHDDPEVGRLRELGPLIRFSATPSRPGRAASGAPGARPAAWPARPPAAAAHAGRGPAPRRALGDLLVLELATWVATPLAATLLAELGARVIKIEPIGGEPFRQVKHGVPWLKTVQGKQSLALDLKRPEAREIVHALVRRADLLLHNYRRGVPERLGIDYPTLRRINPRLIYLYGASYGSTGPCADKPAYHPTAGALCGEALAQLGRAGLPAPDRPLSPDPSSRSRRTATSSRTRPIPIRTRRWRRRPLRCSRSTTARARERARRSRPACCARTRGCSPPTGSIIRDAPRARRPTRGCTVSARSTASTPPPKAGCSSPARGRRASQSCVRASGRRRSRAIPASATRTRVASTTPSWPSSSLPCSRSARPRNGRRSSARAAWAACAPTAAPSRASPSTSRSCARAAS